MKKDEVSKPGKYSCIFWFNSLAAFLILLCMHSSGSAHANAILNFEGEYKYQAVYFKWELNPNLTFQLKEIERSTDSVNFYPCLTFSGITTKQFAWDKQPITGKSYYRLKVIDINGMIEYSAIIMIKIKLIIPCQEIIIQNTNSGANQKTASHKMNHYKILLFDWNGNIRAKNEITTIENYSPDELLKVMHWGEPSILVVMNHNTVVSRQVYYKRKNF